MSTASFVESSIVIERRRGAGRHRAGLNCGDRFSSALATVLGEPLLFKGDDFGQTDVEPVEFSASS